MLYEASSVETKVLKKDKTGYWVAEVPALPGCVSQGKTFVEAKANIKEAIRGWLSVMNKKAKHHQTLSTWLSQQNSPK